jgi:hypothetical protein
MADRIRPLTGFIDRHDGYHLTIGQDNPTMRAVAPNGPRIAHALSGL